MARKKNPLGNWIVRMRCTVEKDVYVEDCTRDAAQTDPFHHSVDEVETGQIDWKVLSVKEN